MSEPSIRVLVVEDEALIRMDLVEMLVELGYIVVGEAINGQAAVDLAQELLPDVVLMDVAMPVRDGLSAAEEIIEQRLAPVVMVTAFSELDTVRHAAQAGAVGYLVKPFSRSDLRPAIELAVSRWAQMVQLEQQVDDLGARVRARDVVDEAKAVLQAQLGMSEAQSFAVLRKQAMDARVTLAEVAAQVLMANPSADHE